MGPEIPVRGPFSRRCRGDAGVSPLSASHLCTLKKQNLGVSLSENDKERHTNLRGPLSQTHLRKHSRANSQKKKLAATHTSTKRSRIGVRLQRVEARIEAGRRNQSLVCPPLDDAAALEHNDLVGRSHRRETVRHRQHRAAAREQGERVMHRALRLRVEARRRLVEQQHARVPHQRARDRDALLLPARQLPAAQAHLCAVARAEVARDEAVGIRGASRFFNLALINALFAVTNILCDRALEEHRLLPNHPNLLPKPPQVECSDVDSVQQQTTHLWVVEALDKGNQRALSRARRAAQRDHLARRNLERVAAAGRAVERRRVRKDHTSHRDFAANRRQPRTILRGGVDARDAVKA
mmetsp:Transcript_24158/g.71881  ORF Transcript_24158/g.71881 Transcript_24158/m.71881 type:complete len:353 (+) Transcript_24158:643-1701(+)